MRLEKTKEINMQVTNKYRIITICNYEHYQNGKQAINKQPNKQLTSNQQATNKQLTTNNNNKEYKNEKNIFIKPTIEEIKIYCLERNNGIDAEKFFYHYEARGWIVGKNKIKDWKSAVITWEKNKKKYEDNSGNNKRSIKHTDQLWN